MNSPSLSADALRCYSQSFTPAARKALALLLQAHETAANFEQNKWDFALEIDALKQAGINHTELRTLIFLGLVEHCLECTRPGAKNRAFRPPQGLRLGSGSCFALASRSLALAQSIRAQTNRDLNQDNHSHGGGQPISVPNWDGMRRELRFGELLVKRFRQPAKNQETILAAFQEEGWPPRIDNPLSDRGNTFAIDRLHDALRRLNQRCGRILLLRRDGNGEGIVWEPASSCAPTAPPHRPRCDP